MRGPAFSIESLSLEERLALLERLWDSLSQRPSDIPFAEAQRRELDRGLDSPEEDVRSGRESAVPGDHVSRRWRERR